MNKHIMKRFYRSKKLKLNRVLKSSPFKCTKARWYRFSVVDPGSGKKIKDFLYLKGVIASLLAEKGCVDIVGCGCGVAGCAGFWSEKFWKTDKLVVWEIEHKRNVYTWCFDRAIYERESLAMLKDMVERHIGWNGLVSPEYDSYEEFCDDVRRLGVKGMFPEVEG